MANKEIDAKISVKSTKATDRTSINDSENLSSIIGKVRKHLDDITDVAFSGSYNDLSDTPEIPDISGKVDKVSGKGLSTNDYTTTEKNKLSGIANGAEVNQNAFSNVTVGTTTITADSKTDTLTLAAGSNITITPDATNDKITIAASQPTVNNGTLTIQKNGTNVATFTANQSGNSTANIAVPTKVSELTNDSGYTTNTGTVTQVKVGSTAYNPSSGIISLPAYPTDTNTHRPIQLNGTEILGNNTTALNLKAGSNVNMSNSNGTVTINATDTNTTYPKAIKSITRSGTTFTATCYDDSTFTFTQQDNNTTYSAGTGIALSGTTFSNSGVRSIATGSTNGTISVNTNGTSTNVAVKGLGSAAYTASTAYAAASHTHSYLPLSGGTLTGILTLHREGATADNVASGIKFSNKDTTTGQTYSSAYIWAYNDHNSGGSYGVNMVIQTGGGLFFGSGESPANHYSAKGSTYNGEETFLTSDGLLHLQANGNTIANRAGVQITTDHALVPEKADVATNNIGSIGTSDYKWANGYFTNINGVAVGNSPKFTDTNTKVTSVGNHYTPAEDSDAQLAASASGATAAWSIDVVKGVTLKRDAKGHITGIAVTSGKIPANPNTDTKVTVSNTNPTTGTWYYPIWYTATSGTGGANANDGFRYYSLQGTASAIGTAYISLGNATASGTAGNKKGILRLYAEKSGYTDIVYTSSATTNATHTFPTTGGTILNTGTTSFTQSLTSGTTVGTIKINGTETTLYAPTNTWRGIQDNLTSSDVTTQSLSAKQGYLLANGSARDNTKLPLSGGTVTGNLMMSSSRIILKGTNIDLDGDNPSSLTWSNSELDFFDKDNDRAGYINVARQTNGSTKLSIMAECRNSDDSGNYYNGIDFIVDRDGNGTYAVSNAANFRSAIGAGTSSLTIGTTSTTAAAGNHSHSYLINSGKLGIDATNIYFQPTTNTTEFNINIAPKAASDKPIAFTTTHTSGYSFDKAIKITGGIDATASLITDTNVVCGSKSATANNGLRCIAQSGEQFNVCMVVASTGAQNLFNGAQYTTTAHTTPVTGPMTIGTTTSTSKITMNCVSSGGFYVPTVYSITGGSANVYVDSSGRLQRSTSSRRYKDNIVYINDEENIYHNALMQMKPVLYNFKSEPDITRMGMIAEDINELCPVAAIDEYESVYNITEEEAMADETLIRECIGKKKTGEIENYEDRAIIAMLVMEVQRLNKEIQELKK